MDGYIYGYIGIPTTQPDYFYYYYIRNLWNSRNLCNVWNVWTCKLYCKLERGVDRARTWKGGDRKKTGQAGRARKARKVVK